MLFLCLCTKHSLIYLITIFDAIFASRQSGQKLQCLYGNPNFTQFVNLNVKILGGRLYSPSLKDLAWLEDTQLIFLISHTFVYKFGWVDEVRGRKNHRQMYGKLEKLTERLVAKLH